MHGLSEIEANKLLVLLSNHHISAEKIEDSDSSWRIAVNDSDLNTAVRVVNRSKLKDKSGIDSIESGMFLSREQRAFAIERALSANVEKTLLVLPGVFEAKVHLNVPTIDPLLGGALKGASGSASVLLICDAGVALVESEVRDLVSGATGIKSDQISVWILQEVEEPLSVQESPQQEPDTLGSEPFTAAFMGHEAYQGIGSVLALLIAGCILLYRRICAKQSKQIPLYSHSPRSGMV